MLMVFLICYAFYVKKFKKPIDGVSNIFQVFGRAMQYFESVSTARDLSEEYKGVSFTGHSLGGGLASANALAIEGKAVTFNAAGLSRATKKNLGLSGNIADITAYIVKSEALDVFQRNVGLRTEYNTLILLPGIGNNAVDRHRMVNVEKAFNLWQKIINDPRTETIEINKPR